MGLPRLLKSNMTSARQRLLAPDLVAEFVAAYAEEAKRTAQEQSGRRDALTSELGRVERQIASIVHAVEDGMYHASMKVRMSALEARQREIEADLAAAPAPEPVALHPNLAGLYRRKVEALEGARMIRAATAGGSNCMAMLPPFSL